MQEKIIFDGKLDAKATEVQTIIDKFLFDNFISPLDIGMDIERKGDKQIWCFNPSSDSKRQEPIINGYVEIISESIVAESPIHLRIVSCRQELDILYFQLSQQIQAKCIIPSFPAEVINIPFRELIETGLIQPLNSEVLQIFQEHPIPSKVQKRYGTNRDLTEEDVKVIVQKCLEFQKRGGSVASFYFDTLRGTSLFTLETLQTWVQNPKFNPNKST